MKDKKTRFFDFIFRHRLAVILAAAAIWILSIIAATRMKLDENFLRLLPDNDREVAGYKQLLDAFDLMDIMIIVLDNGSEDKLISASDMLSEKLLSSGFFEKINKNWNYDDALKALEILKKNRANIFSDEYRKDVEQKIKPDEMDKRFYGWKKTLTEAPVPLMGKMFKEDPLGLDGFAMNELNSFRAFGKSLKVYNGRLFTEDGRHLIIFAKPRKASSDIEFSTGLMKLMDSEIAKISNDKKVRISYLSGHRFSVENAEKMKRGAKISIAVSSLAIIIFSLLFYSRPLLVPLTLLPALFGGSLALGLISCVSSWVSAISIGCGSILLGISVDYGIHVLYHLDKSSCQGTKDNLKELLKNISGPLVIAALTTVAAFAALFFSGLPGYRQLGLFAISGICGAAVFSLAVLPLLVPCSLGAPRKKALLDLSSFYDTVFHFIAGKKKIILIIIAIITLLALPGLLRLKFDGDMNNLNAASEKTLRDRDTVYNVFGDPTASGTIAVKGKNLEDALKKNERLYSKLSKGKSEGKIDSFCSVSPLLPSRKAAAENSLRWKKFWDEKKLPVLDETAKLCGKYGMKKVFFDDFIRGLSEKSPSYLPSAVYRNTMLENILSGMITEKGGETFIITKLGKCSPENFELLKREVNDIIPEATVYQGAAFVRHIMDLIYREFRQTGILSLLLVFIIVKNYGKNIKYTISFLPLLLSIVWTLGILGWLGIKMNVMNCIISIFIFGLLIDYCVFLISAMENENREDYLKNSGGAVTFSALTTIAGLGALTFGGHPALFSLGLSSVIGMTSGFAAILLIIPALCHKEFKK